MKSKNMKEKAGLALRPYLILRCTGLNRISQFYTGFFPLKNRHKATVYRLQNLTSLQSKSECPSLSRHGLVLQTDDNTTAI